MQITIEPFTLQGFNLAAEIAEVRLRIYALNYLVAQSDGRIIQAGSPGSPFYDEWVCTRDGTDLHLPQVTLESTIDALAPAHPESLRYYAGFFDPGGNHLAAMWPKPVFALDVYPNPSTWAHVAAYNSPGVAFDWTTTHEDHYSKEEFDYLLQNPPLVISGIVVLPPLMFDGTTLWIPKASATQDGYISKEDFALFAAGGSVGTVTEIQTGTGLTTATGDPITDSGIILLDDIPGIAGTYANPISISVNAVRD